MKLYTDSKDVLSGRRIARKETGGNFDAISAY